MRVVFIAVWCSLLCAIVCGCVWHMHMAGGGVLAPMEFVRACQPNVLVAVLNDACIETLEDVQHADRHILIAVGVATWVKGCGQVSKAQGK